MAKALVESEPPEDKPASDAYLDVKKVAAARLWAVHKFPYLANAMFATEIVSAPDIKGIATDERWRIYIDPVALDGMEVEMLGSELVHHVGHLLRAHADRARAIGLFDKRELGDTTEPPDCPGDHDAFKRWTLAADMEINDDLTGMQLPLVDEAVQPDDYGFEAGRLAEEYFHQMPGKKCGKCTGKSKCSNCKGGCNCGSASDGIPRSWERKGGGVSKASCKLIQRQVAGEILQHARQNGIGSVPLGMQRWAEELIKPQVDWRQALAAEMRRGLAAAAGAVDYTYRRPSRRSSAVPRVILPALQKPVPMIAIVCDTSGSMGSDQLGQVLAEIDGILRGVGIRGDRVRVLSCDAAVNAVQRINTARDVTFYGGGGTDMGEGIAVACDLKPKPSVIVVLTDGMTPWPADEPPIPVVVGILGDDDPRFRSSQGAGVMGSVPSWARAIRIPESKGK